MDKIILIFDYFKEAFHINKQNKSLYKPQIALIAVKIALILFVGIAVYGWIGVENIRALTAMKSTQIFGFIFSQGLKLIAIMLLYAFISVVIEAGLLNMYKKAVVLGNIEAGDFKEGLSKYFSKLLLGEILIVLCYILAFIPYIILGILSLTVGWSVIPIIAGVFLTMWKVSLVMNDIGIIEAIKDSFGFAKRNFIPLTVLQIIHWAFAKGAVGGSRGGSSNFNFPSNGNFGNGLENQAVDMPGLEEVISIAKIVVAVLLPIIAIGTIVVSIVSIIFEVFFTLALFVTYKRGFIAEEEKPEVPDEISDALEEVHESDNADNTEGSIGEVKQ